MSLAAPKYSAIQGRVEAGTVDDRYAANGVAREAGPSIGTGVEDTVSVLNGNRIADPFGVGRGEPGNAAAPTSAEDGAVR